MTQPLFAMVIQDQEFMAKVSALLPQIQFVHLVGKDDGDMTLIGTPKVTPPAETVADPVPEAVIVQDTCFEEECAEIVPECSGCNVVEDAVVLEEHTGESVADPVLGDTTNG